MLLSPARLPEMTPQVLQLKADLSSPVAALVAGTAAPPAAAADTVKVTTATAARARTNGCNSPLCVLKFARHLFDRLNISACACLTIFVLEKLLDASNKNPKVEIDCPFAQY